MHTESNVIQYPSLVENPPRGLVEGGPDRVKVLLIEDNPGDARLIELMLVEEAAQLFDLERVERLADGLNRLGAVKFGLVLVDLSLPDSQGLNTFLQLQAH